MGTCVIYVDEAGSPDSHSIPIKSGETPIFTLAAIAFPLWEWRARDRSLLSLKRQFFPDYCGKGIRDEEVEIKGRDLAAPRNKRNKRNHIFNQRVLSFIAQNSGCCFGTTFLKNASKPASSQSIYTQALQILVERISLYITEHPAYSNAILVCDSRMRGITGLDIGVARSHMSYIFGHETGRTFINILEAPMFCDSRLTVGLQITDIFASNLYSNHYHYHCGKITGAVDYSHMQTYWKILDKLEFKSKGMLDGYKIFGYRVVDQR